MHINIGCGQTAPQAWVNLDASPTALIERVPVVGRLISRLSGNKTPFPANVRYANIASKLLARPEADAVYASHVLEHMPLEEMRLALRNIYVSLKIGGRLRLIVPDLEGRASAYLEAVRAGDRAAAINFMRSTYLGQEQRTKGVLGRVRGMLGNSRHEWMWDEISMRAELQAAGFTDVQRAEFGDSGDPLFNDVENPDRFHDGAFKEVALDAWKR